MSDDSTESRAQAPADYEEPVGEYDDEYALNDIGLALRLRALAD